MNGRIALACYAAPWAFECAGYGTLKITFGLSITVYTASDGFTSIQQRVTLTDQLFTQRVSYRFSRLTDSISDSFQQAGSESWRTALPFLETVLLT